VKFFEDVMRKKGVMDEEMEAVRFEIEAAVEQSVERARQGTSPDWSAAQADVYTASLVTGAPGAASKGTATQGAHHG